MKHTVRITRHVLWLLLLSSVWFVPQAAAEPLNLACSNQAWSILDGGPLETVKARTGLEIDVQVASSVETWDRLYYGLADLAISAEPLPYRLEQAGLRELPFMKDVLLVISNNRSMIKEMRSEQVRWAFSKRLVNAHDFGGRDRPLTVVAPGGHTALHHNFVRMFMGGEPIAYDVLTNRPADVLLFARRIEGAITFINAGSLNLRQGPPPAVHIVRIDGKGPDDPSYPYFEVFSLVFRQPASEPVQAVLDAFFSPEFCQAAGVACVPRTP